MRGHEHDGRPRTTTGRPYSPAIAEFSVMAAAGVCGRCAGAGVIVPIGEPNAARTCPPCRGTGRREKAA